MALAELDVSSEMRECIDNCFEAAQACEWCADRCAGQGEGMAECIRLCRDVADLTSLHARFMARNSNYSPELAQVVAGAAEECAEECERHDEEHCQVCAETLRKTVESTRAVMA